MSLYKKLIPGIVLVCSSFSMAQASTQPSIFPRGCEIAGFVFDRNFLVLNETGKQAFFMIQNHSDQTVEFEHIETQPDVFMSPKLESQLSPSHWSALASDVRSQYFQCSVKHGEERAVVNCADMLDVCQYPRVKFALSNQGSYWVSTDKAQQQVIKDATAKGIFLHW